MANGCCAKCDRPKAHPKSGYCVEHRREYMRNYMRDKKAGTRPSKPSMGKKGTWTTRYWLADPELFLNRYEQLEEGPLLANIQIILREEGALKPNGRMDYYALHNNWAKIADVLEQVSSTKI